MGFIIGEIISVVLFFVGFYGLIAHKSIMKSIISIGIMETSTVMFLLSVGFSDGFTPPIGHNLQNVSDPLPQALVITAIIIGVAVTAVNLTMCISLCRQYKTEDWQQAKLKRQE